MSTNFLYFYPHRYLRDRQLDTIRNWPTAQVLNRDIVKDKTGEQVCKEKALAENDKFSWKQRLPLINIKLRPKRLPPGAVVYIWGAVIASGPFIIDIDNPFALTGYNLRAMPLYRGLLRRLLASSRCIEIRCLSNACRETLRPLFGEEVYKRATVHYPHVQRMVERVPEKNAGGCRFLFVGTQFEIKGGAALLRAFQRVYEAHPSVHLDVVTHLPKEFAAIAQRSPGIAIHEARFTREEIWKRFMQCADVLVHPTYVESFGIVVLEALAHGLAIVTTDVYALREMLENRKNGALLEPPISIWNGYLPSRYYYDLPRIKEHIRRVDTSAFEDRLFAELLRLAHDRDYCLAARRASLALLKQRFLRKASVDRLKDDPFICSSRLSGLQHNC